MISSTQMRPGMVIKFNNELIRFSAWRTGRRAIFAASYRPKCAICAAAT